MGIGERREVRWLEKKEEEEVQCVLEDKCCKRKELLIFDRMKCYDCRVGEDGART